MPRVAARSPRNSVSDRPGRLRLLLRRQRRLLRPGAWVLSASILVVMVFSLLHASTPGGTLVTFRERLGRATAAAGMRVENVVSEGRAKMPECERKLADLRLASGV